METKDETTNRKYNPCENRNYTNAYGKRNRQLTNKQRTTQAVREPDPPALPGYSKQEPVILKPITQNTQPETVNRLNN